MTDAEIGVVAPPTRGGRQLFNVVEEVAAAHGLRARPRELSPMAYVAACVRDLAVVVDGTIEEGAPNVYGAVSVLPHTLRHVVVAARTPLPLNFVAAERGGAPSYAGPDPHSPLRDAAPGGWDDSAIRTWLDGQISGILDDPGDRLSQAEFDGLATDLEPMMRLIRAGTERYMARLQKQKRVFISYRGHEREAVERLRADLKDGAGDANARDFRVVPPGELALERELLSEGRRWMVLGLLDDELRPCEELWVYASSDYLGSWWTLGELLAWAYIGAEDGARPVRRLLPDAPRSPVDADDLAIALSEDDQRHLAHLFANTRPDSMGIEGGGGRRLMRRLSYVGLDRLVYAGIRMFSRTRRSQSLTRHLPSPGGESVEQIVGDAYSDIDRMRERVRSRVWGKAFWDVLLVDRSATEAAAPYPATVSALLAAVESQDRGRMIRVAGAEAAAAVHEGRPASSIDGRDTIRLAEAAPRYLWHAPRGVKSGRVQRVPVFLAVESE